MLHWRRPRRNSRARVIYHVIYSQVLCPEGFAGFALPVGLRHLPDSGRYIHLVSYVA